MIYMQCMFAKKMFCVCSVDLPARLALGPVWLEVLKVNKHCSTFVLFDKKFPILD
jgi:hypothetical protein